MRASSIIVAVSGLWVGCALVAPAPVRAEPIKSIFVDFGGADPRPLHYEYDGDTGEGELTIEIDSFTLLVTRDVGGVDVPEFYADVSFGMTATALNDISAPPLTAGSVAEGVFSDVSFELRDSGGGLLLAGSQAEDSNLLYTEALIPDVMFIHGGPVEVTGGLFEPDFDVAARLFGIGFQIDPGTGTFGALDTSHSGAVKLNLYPIPEPTSLLLWAVLAGCWGRRHRRQGDSLRDR